ncbi:hypothetical protein Cni_G27731 [Canna indica]|uniref:Uncharacterized protein n=1 Tax=Canna indica TaxID=4628 RepID=A0AAQ3L1P5_9LILI|nr:hypothetical protein Cni_G27731 [Canna indica]
MGDIRRNRSNLESFIAHTTPVVPAYPLKKLQASTLDLNSSCIQSFHDKEYIILRDLWDTFTESSAYGVGVPIILDNCKSVVQYYVPYLSAIQLYTYKSLAASSILQEESETESLSDDSESEKLSRPWDAVSEDSDQNDSWSPRELLGKLYLQYIEYASPYRRIPLIDKVHELSLNYPGLTSFKSMDISPASWISIAWYPIYQIPTCTNAKDLSTCFLTYHTISASFQDSTAPEGMAKDSFGATEDIVRNQKRVSKCLSISPFGLATYKMQGSLWRNPQASDDDTISSLYIAAYSWLKQLGVDHHDFDFFATH